MTESRFSFRHMPWWALLITGTLWIIIAWSVLRFNLTSVATVAALAGVVILLAGIAEFFIASQVASWKWLHILLGVLFLVTSIITFIHPGNTFVWLAALIGWYLLIKGAADIVVAFMTKKENDAWWLGLIVGIVQVLLGFWAAGRFERSAYLLIVLVGAIALARGITDIVAAFRLRNEPDEIAEAVRNATRPLAT